jgi:hypothetical protein
MLYENEKGNEESDNNDLPKEDTEKFIAKAEIPQENTEEKRDEGIVVSKSADEPTDMNNEITDYDIFGMKDRTEIYNAPVTDYPIFEDLRFETAIYYNEDNNGHEAAILDPDNFEYFKGVSRKNSETTVLDSILRICKKSEPALHFPSFCGRKAESRTVVRIFVP